MSPLQFEQRVRGELVLAPLQEPVVNGNIVARTSTERYLSLLEQQTRNRDCTIDPEPFMKSVKIDEAQVKAYTSRIQAHSRHPSRPRSNTSC